MRVGCGVSRKEIRGRPYLYFWSYEDRGGRSVQVFRYMGSARSEATQQRLAQAVDAYFGALEGELRRRKAEVLARAMAP